MGKEIIIMDDGKQVYRGPLKRESDVDITKQNGFIVRYELLGVLIFMLIQTLGGVWWASSQTTNMAYVQKELTQIKVQLQAISDNHYTSVEAEKDFLVRDKHLASLDVRVTQVEKEVLSYGRRAKEVL